MNATQFSFGLISVYLSHLMMKFTFSTLFYFFNIIITITIFAYRRISRCLLESHSYHTASWLSFTGYVYISLCVCVFHIYMCTTRHNLFNCIEELSNVSMAIFSTLQLTFLHRIQFVHAS